MIKKKCHYRVLFCIAFMAVGYVFSSCNNTNSYINHAYSIWGDDEEIVYEDGTYTATVDYYNSKTDYHATYTLEVEVMDGKVVQINFPSGGWLDEDHIIPEYLDEEGACTISSYDGKYYDIQID